MSRQTSPTDLTMSHPNSSNPEFNLAAISQNLQSVLEKLSIIEENQTSLKNNLRVLNDENAKRVEEIKILARQGNALLTEDDDTGKNSSEENGQARENHAGIESSDSEDSEDRGGIPTTPHRPPTRITFTPQTQVRGPIATLAIAAKDLVRTVEVLNGQDDVGVQDFIRSVKRAKARYSQPDLLLDFIITEKIVGNAKRAIRYSTINSFDDLFEVLNHNLNTETSVELCRAKLENCRQ